MILEGKKFNFLGDSITEGTGTTAPDKVYHQLIKARYNLKEARNYGVGGTRIAKQTVPSEKERHDLDFNLRAPEMDDDADVVVIWGGSNDFGHGHANIGSMSDRGLYTFYGAYHCLCQTLINKYPNSRLVIMTPLHRISEDNPCGRRNIKKDIDAPLKVYVDVIKEVAEYYSIPVIDLYAISGLQPNLDIIREKYMPDMLHPNDAGHEILAEVIANALLKL